MYVYFNNHLQPLLCNVSMSSVLLFYLLVAPWMVFFLNQQCPINMKHFSCFNKDILILLYKDRFLSLFILKGLRWVFTTNDKIGIFIKKLLSVGLNMKHGHIFEQGTFQCLSYVQTGFSLSLSIVDTFNFILICK